MFDYLFKRAGKPAAVSDVPVKPSADEKAQAVNQAKQDALKKAESLAGDEAAAEEFILNCQFADARLIAAGHLVSRGVLDRVFPAMRNTDRRVSKLLQSRLEMMDEQERNEKRATDCIAQANRLLQDVQLTPNLVSDLDRTWLVAGLVPDVLRTQFETVRAQLRNRLESQAALQRAVIDVLAQLNKLIGDSGTVATADRARSMSLLEQMMARHATDAEAASVPKQLFIEFADKLAAHKQYLSLLEQNAAAIAARESMLAGWEAAEPDSLKPATLKQEWRAQPAMENDALWVPLQQRFNALLEKLEAIHRPKEKTKEESSQESRQRIADLLSQLEKALEEGSLQSASEADRNLRAIDSKSFRLSDSQSRHLANLRAELKRLQGWAKWGGHVSREELLKAAEGLPSQSLNPTELAKKVGSLRERWKSLDGSAGPAGKDLWQSFDAACTTAYAPAAEHFRKLAEERQHNADKARLLIDEAKSFAANAAPDVEGAAVDPKAFAGFCMRVTGQWQKLGAVDRKEKRQLDAEFNEAMQPLLERLTELRAMEIKQRERMIAEAGNINPGNRNALDDVRSLQERWQAHAKSLPLEHKDEQALWLRFREACDQVFAKRKEFANAADAERKQNLQAREALCVELESAVNAEIKDLSRLLKQSKEAWRKIGAVPRALEEKIEKRYQDAAAALQMKLGEYKKNEAIAELFALESKMNLCRAIEKTLADGAAPEHSSLDTYRNEWDGLPALRPEFERKMRHRFDSAITAQQSNDRQYATRLASHEESFARQVMLLEIAMGIDSPAALSKERLRLQVEVLQSSLKTGDKGLNNKDSLAARLVDLCGTAVLAEPSLNNRLSQLINRFKNAAI